MNISRTGFFPDLRFSQEPQIWLVLPFSSTKSTNSRARFREKVEKPSKMTHFWNYWMIRSFRQKSGRVTFLRLSMSDFMQKIRKIYRTVTEIWCFLTNQQTNVHFGGLTQLKLRTDNLPEARISTLVFRTCVGIALLNFYTYLNLNWSIEVQIQLQIAINFESTRSNTNSID